MVVLSASIVTKGGKPIISRQFRELPRARLESLLSTFPKLVLPASQHTVIDDPVSAIRYVYQPLDDLWLVILTNRQSNILQDIDTLHLLSRVASDFCRGGLTEGDVLARSFEILSSFDEVVSMGYREKVDLNGIRNVMEMESHEEKIQEIIARNKEQEAKEELKRRAKQLDMQRREAAKRGQNEMYGGSGVAAYERTYQPPSIVPTPREELYATPVSTAAKPFKTKGMQLGGAKDGKGGRQQAGLLDALGDEYGVVEEPPPNAFPTPPPPAVQPAQLSLSHAQLPKSNNPFAPAVQEDVHFVIREKLSAELSRDGGLSQTLAGVTVSGSLDLRVGSVATSKISLQVAHSNEFGNDLQFKTHPNVDKKAWSESRTLRLRDASKGFPVGQGLGVLKWRLTTKDESCIPLSINCWPTLNDDGNCDVNIEYELEAADVTLADVMISIPLPEEAYPAVASADGSYAVNSTAHTLEWHIPKIQQDNKSGSMEFSCPGGDADTFFPVSVTFLAHHGLCKVSVLKVAAVADNSALQYSVDSLMAAEDYIVA